MSRGEPNLTEAQWAEMQRARKGGDAAAKERASERTNEPIPAHSKARGINRWEQEYAMELEARKRAGEILWYQFEALRFRLADGAWYKPDFAAFTSAGVLELYEIKGHWREAARIRIKVAADRHPFRFIALQKRRVRDRGGWDREEFSECLERIK